jgi:hypothetical protein
MRIIACDNWDGGDDGRRHSGGGRLRDLGIDAQTSSGAAFDLIEAWRGADEVIVIDAVRSGARPCMARLWDDGRISELSMA